MNEELLKQIPLFESLSKDARAFIASRLKIETFPSGELIVRQGDTGDSLYIITNGLVKVTKREKTGTSKELARLRTGDYFGEMSLLTEQPRSADITTITNTTTLVLLKKDMDEILCQYPTIAMHFSKVLSKRLRDTSQLHLGTKPAVSVISIYTRQVDALAKSVLTFNLAASFSKELMKRVILVDADEDESQLGDMLQVNFQKLTKEHLGKQEDIVELPDLTPCIYEHYTGLHILSVTAGAKLKQRTYEKNIAPLLETLQRTYDYILINCPKTITKLTHSALDHSDLIVYLTPISDEAFRRCKKDADAFMQGYQDMHRNLIIGVLKEERQASVSVPGLEETFAPHSFHLIQNDTNRVEQFVKTGKPFVFEYPKNALSRSIQRLARRIGHVRVGLALGSGAARGFAHVGVLKTLEMHDIPIDMIAGTSMGAFVGGFYAAGVSARELEEMVRDYRDKFKVKRTIFDLTIPLYGLSKGNNLSKLLRNSLGDITFSELQIPFVAVATDISNGSEVILRHGILWKALRASASVPVMFEPFFLDGRYLIDGGITNPLPTDILIENNIDFIISCTVNTVYASKNSIEKAAEEHSRIAPRKKKYGIIDALIRTMGIMSATNTLHKARLADIDLRPDVSHIDWTDFHRGDEILREGERAAEEALPTILELLHGSKR